MGANTAFPRHATRTGGRPVATYRTHPTCRRRLRERQGARQLRAHRYPRRGAHPQGTHSLSHSPTDGWQVHSAADRRAHSPTPIALRPPTQSRAANERRDAAARLRALLTTPHPPSQSRAYSGAHRRRSPHHDLPTATRMHARDTSACPSHLSCLCTLVLWLLRFWAKGCQDLKRLFDTGVSSRTSPSLADGGAVGVAV